MITGGKFDTKQEKMTTESVKISSAVVAKVRKMKKKTGVNVGKFFEIAAVEKMEREKAKSKSESPESGIGEAGA